MKYHYIALLLLTGCATHPESRSAIHDYTIARAEQVANCDGSTIGNLKVKTLDVKGAWDARTSRYMHNGKASWCGGKVGSVRVVYITGPNGERDGAENHEAAHVYLIGVHGDRSHHKRLRKCGLTNWHEK